MSTTPFPPLPPGMDPTVHPDLHPFDQACNATTHDLEAGLARQQAAAEELRAATQALPALKAAALEANEQWSQATQAFRELHRLPRTADLGFAATRHLRAHG